MRDAARMEAALRKAHRLLDDKTFGVLHLFPAAANEALWPEAEVLIQQAVDAIREGLDLEPLYRDSPEQATLKERAADRSTESAERVALQRAILRAIAQADAE